MRRLCAFLVLVNIIYFLWQTRTQENIANLPINQATPSLMLLSELQSNVSSTLSNKNKADELIPAVGTNAAIPNKTSVTPTEASTISPTKVLTTTQSCIVLRGFVNQVSAEKAARFLSDHGVESELDMPDMQGADSYLVYLPPFESRAAALIKFHELKTKEIDSFIIAEGDRINGISLGVFAKEESAKKLQAQLKDKGYNPLIVNSSRITRQYNLRIASQSKEILTESLRAELSQKYAGGKLTRAELPCAE